MRHLKSPDCKDVRLTGEFWKKRQALFAGYTAKEQWKILNGEREIEGVGRYPCVDNFRIAAGEAEGEYRGNCFADHDLFKWAEGAVYALTLYYDDELKRYFDEAVRLIQKVQCDDGYLNTYYTLKEPGKRFTEFAEGHELLNLGNLIEAAVAAKKNLNDGRLLAVAERFVDCVYDYVMHADKYVYDGHEEIELALQKLYLLTGERKYIELADRFVNTRGVGHCLFLDENARFSLEHYQAHAPVREQKEAVGHAVRAAYLYTAMARQAEIDCDEELLKTTKNLYESIVKRKMYITGGIGSEHFGERFTLDYDLPSDRCFAETCAEAGFMMLCKALLSSSPDSGIADVMERVLYNGLLAGVSEDGDGYFYSNPLFVNPATAGYRADTCVTKTRRMRWMNCPCCPPNILRLILSLGEYVCSYDDGNVYLNLHLSSRVKIDGVTYTFECGEPYGDTVTVKADRDTDKTVWVKVPYFTSVREKTENGYIAVRGLKKGKAVRLCFAREPRFVYANGKVDDAAGKVAVEYGYLVYCAEEADNGAQLSSLTIDDTRPVTVRGKSGEFTVLEAEGERLVSNGDRLYVFDRPVRKRQSAVLVPYCHWGNRGEGEMTVWLKVK